MDTTEEQPVERKYSREVVAESAPYLRHYFLCASARQVTTRSAPLALTGFITEYLEDRDLELRAVTGPDTKKQYLRVCGIGDQ